MDFKRLAESLAKTESEIREESANSLGRVGKALLAQIAKLEALHARFAACPVEERALLREEYRLEDAEARKLFWYLTVQREAMGLRRHDDLVRHYVIPGPLPRE